MGSSSKWTVGSCFTVLTANADSKCLVCDKHLQECGVKCCECKRAVHIECTELPLYHLIRLASSRTAYMCERCVRGSDRVDYAELEADIQHLRRRQAVDSADDMEETTEASAPNLSQLPLTQDIHKDDEARIEGWASNSSEDKSSKVQRTVRPEAQRREDKQKHKICKFSKAGACKYGRTGNGCHYSHPKKCYSYIRHGKKGDKGCQKGDKCEYYHPPLCHESVMRGTCSREKCKFQHLQVTKKYTKKSVPRKAGQLSNRIGEERVAERPGGQLHGGLRRSGGSYELLQDTVQAAPDPFLEFREELARIRRQLDRAAQYREEVNLVPQNSCTCRRGGCHPSSHIM